MIYLLIVLLISESIRLLVHVQLVSLLQWHLSSMQWSIYSHRSTYQWIDSSISSRATSEPASMTSILNAMIYSLSSFYSSVNLIIRSHATSEPASMTSILNAMIYSLSSFYSSVNLIIRSRATSEPATMTSSKSISSLSKSISFLHS